MSNKKKFKKVVEWKSYNWQEKELDVSHLLIFLAGLGISMAIFSKDIITMFIGLGFYILAYLMKFLKKRKVHWEEIK